MKINNHEILLLGIVGSTAYGLNHSGSDVDRLGIFIAPTSAFHGLTFPTETYVNLKTMPPSSLGVIGDMTIHEARKWCKLAMSCNPTVSELVWLPDQLIEMSSTWGSELRTIRSCFPTAQGVRNAYLGYATQQLKRLKDRGDGSFSADTRKRTAKHARHLFRLCHQGLEFYQSGRLPIRLEPETIAAVRAFGERVASGDVPAAEQMIHGYEQKFDRAKTALGDRPDEERIERWLRAVRHAYWKDAKDVDHIQQRDALVHAQLLAHRTGTSRYDDRSRDVPPRRREG